MKNKKIIWLGIGVAAAVGISGMFIYQGSNSKEVETMAMAEQAEEPDEGLAEEPVKEPIEEPETQLSEKTVETAETKGREKKLGGAVEETVVKAVELMVNTYETYARGEMAGTELAEAGTEEPDNESEGEFISNSTHDDVVLGEDEYKGDDPLDVGITIDEENDIIAEEGLDMGELMDEVAKKVMEEHPELFENNNGGGNGGYTQGYDPADWEGIGTPSTGVDNRPDFDIYSADMTGASKNAVVY